MLNEKEKQSRGGFSLCDITTLFLFHLYFISLFCFVFLFATPLKIPTKTNLSLNISENKIAKNVHKRFLFRSLFLLSPTNESRCNLLLAWLSSRAIYFHTLKAMYFRFLCSFSLSGLHVWMEAANRFGNNKNVIKWKMPHRHLRMAKYTEYLSVKLISATSATKYQVSRFRWLFFLIVCAKWNDSVRECVRLYYFKIAQKQKRRQSFLLYKSVEKQSAVEPENRKIDNANNKEPTMATTST